MGVEFGVKDEEKIKIESPRNGGSSIVGSLIEQS